MMTILNIYKMLINKIFVINIYKSQRLINLKVLMNILKRKKFKKSKINNMRNFIYIQLITTLIKNLDKL
jgi:hypothetical protein